MQPEGAGRVLLVGAGPGAADLLTVRAVRALAVADVVLADALVTDEVRSLIRPSARIIEVGKRGHRPSTPQDFINRLMLRLARTGNLVIRLKGGDPSIFGRAGEERAYLEAHGVEVEVIPGITAASAAAAEHHFSLTTRGEARRVVFSTGRTEEGSMGEWAADPSSTLCLYMGCADIGRIASDLIAAGLSPQTPAIAAIAISRPTSRLVPSRLCDLHHDLAREKSDAPVLICIGTACAAAVSHVEQSVSPPSASPLAC